LYSDLVLNREYFLGFSTVDGVTGAAILVEKSVVLADQQNNLMLDCPHQ
jgi:hypothetical protein